MERGQRALAGLALDATLQTTSAQHLALFARDGAGGRGTSVVRALRTAGLPAADVEERLVDWLGRDGEVTVATIPADGEVWVRLRARASTPAEATRSLAKAETGIGALLGEDCYGRDGETLEMVVGRMLLERQLTLAVAESCTGGLPGHPPPNAPRSAAPFERRAPAHSQPAEGEPRGGP